MNLARYGPVAVHGIEGQGQAPNFEHSMPLERHVAIWPIVDA